MDYIFDDWKDALADFKNCVEKDLEEIRQQKAEMLHIKAAIENDFVCGNYIRDERRIVLSAPEVIIGNVDKSGCMLDGGKIIIRGNGIALDGVGDTGSVTTRAASIRQIAADPGVDGNEAVVGNISEVVSQARTITIQSNDNDKVFSVPPAGALPGGVYIHADGTLDLDASQSSELKKTAIQDQIDRITAQKDNYKQQVDDYKAAIDKVFGDMADLMDQVEDLRGSDDDVRSNALDIRDLNDQILSMSPSVYVAVDNYIDSVSKLAEANRQIKELKDQKDNIVSGDDFKNNSTDAGVNLRGEYISVISADGDGNYRDNPGAGLNVIANQVSVAAIEQDGQLKENGVIGVNAKTIGISTANTKMSDAENGEITSVGDIVITTKTLSVQAVDTDIKDSEPEEKALTADSALSVRFEKTDISATDTEGKATGSISINSKAVEVKSMDVDKDSRADSALAQGSTMLLLAEKMYVGAKDSDNKSKKFQAVSEEMGLFADKTLEVQQDSGSAMLQLDGGNASITGSKTQIYGATTINAKTEIKDELKAPKATIDNIEAKTSFKSSNISDGFPVPAAPASASLSAKLKTEDAPKEES